MQTQSSTPTRIASSGRSRSIVIMLAGLLVLAAAVIGGIFALSRRPPVADVASRGVTTRPLIARCRACQDEVLAARQGVVPNAGRATQPVAADINARPLIATCRACQDEVLAARQGPVLATPQTTKPIMPRPSARALIASCRVCRDEVLGSAATSADVDSSFVWPPSTEVLRRNGPR